MSVTNLLILALIATFLLVGKLILERLPKREKTELTHWEKAEYRSSEWLDIAIDDVVEDGFSALYIFPIEEWRIGRSFEMHGKVIDCSEEDEASHAKPFSIQERCQVNVISVGEWDDRSRLGSFDGGSRKFFIRLPHQVASNLLEELRRNPNQTARIKYAEKADHSPDAIAVIRVDGFVLIERE
jgi:hypothetical protein